MQFRSGFAVLAVLPAAVAVLAAALLALPPHRAVLVPNASGPGNLTSPRTTPRLPRPAPISMISRRLHRFQQLDAQLGFAEAKTRPDPTAVKAMEIVNAETLAWINRRPAITDEQLARVLRPYARAAAENDSGSLCDFSWIKVNTARHAGQIAIEVSYGPVSRLALFDSHSAKRLQVPWQLEWLVPWGSGVLSTPHFFEDGGLAVISHWVSDAGMDAPFRVDFLSPSHSGCRLKKSIYRGANLEYGGTEIKGPQMIFTSIDRPRIMLGSASSTLFKSTEVYSVHNGIPNLVSLQKESPDLRFLDQWMSNARSARKPNRLQKVFSTLDSGMFSSDSEKRLNNHTLQVDIRFDEATIRFVLHTGKQYQMLSVRRLK